MWFTSESALSRLIAADRQTHFRLFLYLVLHNCAIRACSMRYAKMDDLDRDELRRRQKLCITLKLHYDRMRYDRFNCTYVFHSITFLR